MEIDAFRDVNIPTCGNTLKLASNLVAVTQNSDLLVFPFWVAGVWSLFFPAEMIKTIYLAT